MSRILCLSSFLSAFVFSLPVSIRSLFVWERPGHCAVTPTLSCVIENKGVFVTRELRWIGFSFFPPPLFFFFFSFLYDCRHKKKTRDQPRKSSVKMEFQNDTNNSKVMNGFFIKIRKKKKTRIVCNYQYRFELL